MHIIRADVSVGQEAVLDIDAVTVYFQRARHQPPGKGFVHYTQRSNCAVRSSVGQFVLWSEWIMTEFSDLVLFTALYSTLLEVVYHLCLAK